MGYIEDLRVLVGNQPLILVRPSIVILNKEGHILLVQYQNRSWGIPGGLMELGESVEESARREVREEIGLEIKKLELIGVLSGKEWFTRLKNGHEYYNVIIGYLCTDYEGEIMPDMEEVIHAAFFDWDEIPEHTPPMIKSQLEEIAVKVKQQATAHVLV